MGRELDLEGRLPLVCRARSCCSASDRRGTGFRLISEGRREGVRWREEEDGDVGGVEREELETVGASEAIEWSAPGIVTVIVGPAILRSSARARER